MGKTEQKGKPTKPNDSNPEHHYFYNSKKNSWFWVTEDEPRKKHWVQADKEKADEKAKETPVEKTTTKEKVTGGKVYKKPSATEKPPTINWSKKGGEKTTSTKKIGTGGHAGRTKTEKVTPTADKTAVPTKNWSTKLRKKTTSTKEIGTGGLGGRTKTETDVEPETTTEAPQERVTGRNQRPWLANKTTEKPKAEKPKVEVEKPKVEKTKAEKAADTKPGRKIPKFGEKKNSTKEFRELEGELPKSGTKVEKAKESEDVKKKSGGKEGYFSRIKKVLSKKGKGVNARETYRRQRKRGGSTKDLLTKDRNKKFTMTGSRGKGLDVDSPNKTYDSRYKVKKGEKGGSTSPKNNKKIPTWDKKAKSSTAEFRARGGKELSMEEKQPLNKKAAEKYGTIHKPAKVEKPAVGNNIKKVKSTWNTTSMTDSQLKTRNKRTFNVLKSRGR